MRWRRNTSVKRKQIYNEYLHRHADDVQGRLGLADAELGLKEYEAAEIDYRHVAAVQPLLWAAHKNLVIVEAALGRWDEFDREREVLRAARQRGAAGLSAREERCDRHVDDSRRPVDRAQLL